MGKLVIEATETVIRDERGLWLKSGIRALGARICLTGRRLVIVQPGIPALGLLGLLFNKQGTVRVEVTRDDFVGFERDTFGASDNVLVVRTKAGDAHRVLLATPYEEWDAALRSW